MPNRLLPYAFFAVFLLSIISPGQAEEFSCGQLLVERCDSCHYISRPCQNLGNKSRWRWKRTLNTMIRHGAQLTNAEAEQLLTCLSDQEATILMVCKDPLRFKRPLPQDQNQPGTTSK